MENCNPFTNSCYDSATFYQQYEFELLPVVPHKAVAEVSKIGNL